MIDKFKKKFFNNENNLIIFKNVSGAFVMRGGALLISLFTMPAFISYFNNQSVLGVWYTVLSVITWVLNFDLGIGNGLRNNLVVSIAQKDKKRSRELISSAYIMIGIIVVALTFVGYISSSVINWNSLFNISTDLVSATALLTVVRCIFIGIMAQFFFRLISTILYAMQKSALNNFISLVISVLQLCFVLVAPSGTPQENLIVLSYAYIIITTLPYLIATIMVFTTKFRKLAPSFRCFEKTAAKAVLGTGGVFFLCQVLYMVLLNTNDFFITRFTAPEYTVEYNAYFKLFSIAGTVAALALTPIWSLVTKAIAEKQHAWLRKLLNKATVLSGVVVVGELILAVVLQFGFDIWLKDASFKVNYIYAFIFAAWGSVFVYHNVLSTFACGVGKMKLQAICYALGVAFKFVFLIIIYQYTQSWIFVVLSNLIVLLPYCVLQRFALKKEFNKKKEE